MVATQAILVIVVAFMLGIAEALQAIEGLPLSTETCRLAGVALISVLLVLLQSKQQKEKSTEASEASGKSTEIQGPKWWYKDATGKVHGPFPTSQMKQWHKEGYMTSSLMVKFGDMTSFRPLRVIFPNGSVPFVSDPQVPAKTQEPPAEEEPPAWSSDDEQATIRKWRARRRAQYKETVHCEMVEPVH
eukprot:gnl/MRDRNA2_/MRDRNA2_87048_c0_seq1.p1 gnl/MRDRNA2_/MRDRNA2_87048_c0~~gnl/MRDRNA2_/MRDRNA2_87048_c0_seq1.p1  ORF type:complete len:188 (+),score=52.02 gnl/MRDRNA2_/MRDRNA2_87048_c0_seq1:138-701(+)